MMIVLLLFLLLFLKPTESYMCQEWSDTCVCDIKAALSYLNDQNAMSLQNSYASYTKSVSDQIQEYYCQRFNPLPPTLRIYDQSAIDWTQVQPPQMFPQRRRLKRQYQPLQPGERGYDVVLPRPQYTLGYPSHDTFMSIKPSLDRRANHHYIPLGGPVLLPCYTEGTDGTYEYPPVFDGYYRHVDWFHAHNVRVITSAETWVLQTSGELSFGAVQLSDTDVYRCNVSYTPIPNHFQGQNHQEKPENVVFEQQLDVVAEPILWLQFLTSYTVEKCSQKEAHLISSYLKSWVHTHVCNFCPVRNYSVSCDEGRVWSSGHRRNSDVDPDFDEEEDISVIGSGPRTLNISLTLSSLGMEKHAPSFGSYTVKCGLDCVELAHSEVLEIAQKNLERMFSLIIEVESAKVGVGGGTLTSYIPQRWFGGELKKGCPTGFFENLKMCFPCPPGFYSPNGKDECRKCQVGKYTPSPGSGVCLPCPKGYSTFGEGSVAEYECKLEAMVGIWNSKIWPFIAQYSLYFSILGAALLFLLVGICFIPWCFPKSRLGRCCAPCSCFAPDPDFQLLEDEDDDQKRINNNSSVTNVEAIDSEQQIQEQGSKVILVEVPSTHKPQQLLLTIEDEKASVQNVSKDAAERSSAAAIIPVPPPLPLPPSSYWASTPKNSKISRLKATRKRIPPPPALFSVVQQTQKDRQSQQPNDTLQVNLLTSTTPNEFRMHKSASFGAALELDSSSASEANNGHQFTRTSVSLPKFEEKRSNLSKTVSKTKSNKAVAFSPSCQLQKFTPPPSYEQDDHLYHTPKGGLAPKLEMKELAKRFENKNEIKYIKISDQGDDALRGGGDFDNSSRELSPVNVRKIAKKLETQRRFSSGWLESGKVPPGAFTYIPPLPPPPLDKDPQLKRRTKSRKSFFR